MWAHIICHGALRLILSEYFFCLLKSWSLRLGVQETLIVQLIILSVE